MNMRPRRPSAVVAFLAAALAILLPLVACGTSSPVAVTGLTVAPKAVSVAVNDTQTLAVAIAPPNASDKAITWTTSDAAVATVSAAGIVTGVAEGTATITAAARDGGRTDTCAVTVTAARVTVSHIEFWSSLSLVHGGYPNSASLFANVYPSNVTNRTVTWMSSDPKVASVNPGASRMVDALDPAPVTAGTNTGTYTMAHTAVTAVAAGTAVITVSADDGRMTAECIIEVTEEPDVMGQEWGLAKNSDVYIVGWGNRLFKNGVTTRLAYQDPPFRSATAVFVSGGDVHVAGEANVETTNYSAYPLYWKNGVTQALDDEQTYHGSYVSDMFVSGDDVYVAGAYSGFYPALWVNGERQVLGRGTGINPAAWTVFVSGGDIYAGGADGLGSAPLWKNGEMMGISSGKPHRYKWISSIFAAGEDVYATLYEYDPWLDDAYAWLYKNGEYTLLATSSTSLIFPISVVVSGDDVYVLLTEHDTGKDAAVVWKNGTKQRLVGLTDGSTEAHGSALAVSGGDVYVVGYQNKDGSRGSMIPTLWINGDPVDLRPSGLIEQALDVFVVEKK